MTRAGYLKPSSVEDNRFSELRRSSRFQSALKLRGHTETDTLNLEAEVMLQIKAPYLHTRPTRRVILATYPELTSRQRSRSRCTDTAAILKPMSTIQQAALERV